MGACGVITWRNIQPMAVHYFRYWPDGEGLLWLKKIWPAIERSGVTFYYSESENAVARTYVAVASLFYQECINAFGVDPDWCLGEDEYKEIFDDDPDDVSMRLIKIREACLTEFGEQDFYDLTLKSIVLGMNGPMTRAGELLLLKEHKPFKADNAQAVRLFELLTGRLLDIDCMESIPCSVEHYMND